ncbi:MAG: NAD(P)H-dependent oxidoreductase subunit E, partial [Roseiarcus sp.]
MTCIIREGDQYANVSARPDLRDNRSGPSRGRSAGATRRRFDASAANPHQGQERLDWLPPRAVTRIAAALGLSRARVEGVVGFYSFL